MRNGLDDEIDGYMDEGFASYGTTASVADVASPATAPASAPSAPRPHPPVQNFAPPTPRTGPMVSVLFRGLGDFDILGRCAIIALARVAWLFWSKVADGQTTVALGILELYRSLWNLKRSAIASGFIGHGAEHLPGVLPAAQWSQDMRYSMAYSIAGATGFHTDIAAVLAVMPDNMAALPPWFRRLTSTLPAADLPSVRAYVDSPLPSSGDPVVYYAGYVRDDLSQCGPAPAPAPSPAPAPAPAPTPAPAPPQQLPSGSSSSPGAGASSSTGRTGGTGFILLMLAILSYGGYLAYQDSKPKDGQ